jgi:hypothetical protein
VLSLLAEVFHVEYVRTATARVALALRHNEECTRCRIGLRDFVKARPPTGHIQRGLGGCAFFGVGVK